MTIEKHVSTMLHNIRSQFNPVSRMCVYTEDSDLDLH